jgi:RNA recognition motif-containing protein
MAFHELIILSLYYPQFYSPINSRFESFFSSLKKKEKKDIYSKKKINKSNKIFPEKIARNEDKRTSLIIKGIPDYFSKNDIYNYFTKFGNINFFYISQKLKNNKSTLTAFINVINYKSIIPIFMNLRNLKIINGENIYNIEVTYSKIQGKQKLKQYIKEKDFKLSKL